MRLPDFLPAELNRYGSFEEDKALFHALKQQQKHLITFFEYGTNDESWAVQHPLFIKSTLRWAAKHYYLGKLSEYDGRLFAKMIQNHHALLRPFLIFRPALFSTIRLKIEDQLIRVNSLLFGAATPFFKNLFLNCYEQLIDEWQLPGTSLFIFRLIEEYITKGEISDLWRHEEKEVYALMKQAKAWQLVGLEIACADVLKRYFNRQDILKNVLDAHLHFFIPYKRLAFDYFNHQEQGLRLISGRDSDFKVEVLDYRQETLELFDQVAALATHLAFSGDLSNEPEFRVLIDKCPKLLGVDLSGTQYYSGQFLQLPGSLMELNLSACPWVKPEILQQVSTRFPGLKNLVLASNVHLNFQTWGMLNRFHQLISLDLSRCHQINDEDLKLIEKGCPHLIELNLEECRLITNKGLAELLASCPSLISLDISRSVLLTDKALAEIGIHGSQITHLNIMHGKGFTDKGLLQMLRMRSNLAYLNVKGCHFSLQAIAKVRQEYPYLELED